MHELTGFQRDLLVVIAGLGAPKGVAVKAELDEYASSEVFHGRLYPNLDLLVERGLVEKGKIDDRTNSYSLTDAGSNALAERRAWEDAHVGDLL